MPPEEELTPEQREIMARFEEGLREHFQNLPQPDEMVEMIEQQTVARIREGLRVRGVPEEWWEHRLIEVEAHVTEGDGAMTFEVEIPEDFQRWMQRRPIYYDPGRPPV